MAGAGSGYDARMSESTSENGSPSDDEQLISDEQLPEDLQPEKNPMARDPEDTDEQGGGSAPGADGADGADGAAGADGTAGGAPDAGQPG